MILPYVFMDVLSFIGTISAPQSDLIGICWFGIVLLHLPQYKKVSVRQVLLITSSSIMWIHRAYLLCNQPWIILLCLVGISQWSSRGICVFYPRVMIIFAIFPYSMSISERTLETISGSTCDKFRSSTCQSMVHCLSLTILFITHQSY